MTNRFRLTRLILAIAAVPLFALPAFAQLTTVTGAVKDGNGLAYAGAQMKAQLVFAGTPVSNPTVQITGLAACKANGFGVSPCNVPFSPNQGPFNLDNGGNLPGGGISLQDNSLVLPAGTQWAFAINSNGNPPPLGTGPQTCNATLTISGASQSVTPSFSSCPALSNVASGGSSSTTAGVVTSGILGYYKGLPADNPAALTDYSGNGNTGIGTVGTAPTIATGGNGNAGGLSCPGTGAVILPAALNNAKTIQILTVPTQSAVAGFEAPVMSNNGGSGTTGGVGMILGQGNFPCTLNTGSCGAPVQGGWHVQTNGGNVGTGYSMGSYTLGSAPVNVGMVMSTLDKIYVNGVEEIFYNYQLTPSSGLNASNFQLCGSATGVTPSMYHTGLIISAVFYNRVLTPAELWQNATAQCNDAIARGQEMLCPNEQQVFPNYTNDVLCHIGADDDSLGNAGRQGGWLYPVNSYFNGGVTLSTTACPSGWNVALSSRPGQTSATGLTSEPRIIDGFISQLTGTNLVTVWYGRNDACAPSAGEVLNNMVGNIRQRKIAGWNYAIPFSMTDYTTGDACKNTYNTLFRAYPWPDGVIDVGSDANIGADGSSASATYFSDGTHFTYLTQQNDVSPMAQRVINRKIGNTNWATATTYTSAAAAAVATTAGSSSGQTATVTFGATPANCQAGSIIVVTGVTPAGYNTVANTGAMILTRTATQVTYTTPGSGLGAITVQGSASCPQQQPVDMYTILNFGAGNFTMDSCLGYTGQNVYYKNINAASSTLVPFTSSETIDGAATLAIAQNVIVGLQAVVPNSSTAGCVWRRIQ